MKRTFHFDTTFLFIEKNYNNVRWLKQVFK